MSQDNSPPTLRPADHDQSRPMLHRVFCKALIALGIIPIIGVPCLLWRMATSYTFRTRFELVFSSDQDAARAHSWGIPREQVPVISMNKGLQQVMVLVQVLVLWASLSVLTALA